MRGISRCSHLFLGVLLVASCDEDSALGPSSVVESVAVVPALFSLVVGDTLRLTTLARGELGNPLVGHSVTWGSSAPSVATIAQNGLVTASGPGSSRITATVDGQTGIADVTVSLRFPNTTFASVTAGGAHTCALSSNGEAWCWGRSENGQLGVPKPVTTCLSDQTYPCALVPLPVSGGKVFTRISGGGAHTCGLTSDGTAWCWGTNQSGQLGDSSSTSRDAPVAVKTSVRFTSIDAGNGHTCGLTAAGAAWCWGTNGSGELGDGTQSSPRLPVPVSAPAGVTFRSIAVGGGPFRNFTCALATTGTAYCWGTNSGGQLGRGTQDFSLHAQPEAVSGSLTFTALAAGLGNHTCGLTAAGAAHCWGMNFNGALGDGSTVNSYFPLAVAGGLTFTQLVIGGFEDRAHTCGLTSAGMAYCWGDNQVGAVGDGSGSERRTPVAVAGGLTFATLEAGFRHTCGRTNAGVLYCWGSGRVGQLGANTVVSSFVPVKVTGQQ